MTQKYQVLLFILLQVAKHVNQMPISVPVDYYSESLSARYPNSQFNRLPGNRYPIQTDPLVGSNSNDNSVTDEYEDFDEQTSNKPNAQYSSSNYNSNSNYSPLLTESFNKHKRRRRKKIRRPCIPVQSFNSPLFSNNRYKRDVDSGESGKTLGHLFGFNYPPPIGTQYYGNYPAATGYPQRPYFQNNKPPYDNVRPEYDRPQYDQPGSNQPLYNPVGGYPCIPVSYGHVPFTGPFGFFGSGGLFDMGTSPSLSIPQTVVINRPPLFGNRPSYFGQGGQGGQGGQADVSGDGQPGFWGSVVDKLSEFVTSVSPQAVYSAIGDTLQGIGNAIQNAQPATAAVDTIRNGYREFSSLIFR